jgi:hypothetical protein
MAKSCFEEVEESDGVTMTDQNSYILNQVMV